MRSSALSSVICLLLQRHACRPDRSIPSDSQRRKIPDCRRNHAVAMTHSQICGSLTLGLGDFFSFKQDLHVADAGRDAKIASRPELRAESPGTCGRMQPFLLLVALRGGASTKHVARTRSKRCYDGSRCPEIGERRVTGLFPTNMILYEDTAVSEEGRVIECAVQYCMKATGWFRWRARHAAQRGLRVAIFGWTIAVPQGHALNVSNIVE
nr:hypothetical protein CFP56_38790 [Quercus suber]